MFPDSDIANKYSCARTKATAISNCVAASHTQELVQKMKQQLFSLATDGSNDKGAAQLYPIVVRIFDENIGSVVTELLSIVDCDGPSTGENIFKLLDRGLTTHNITWANVTSFGCDNASVMTGRHKGVASHIHKVNPNVFISGCACRLLHLAAKTGCKELHRDVEGALLDIYYYLEKSSKRQKELQAFQNECGVNLSKILKHGATRWLSLHNCVNRLMEQWDALQAFFEAEVAAVPKKAQTSSKYDRLRKIQKFLTDSSSKLYCFFLQEVLPVFINSNLMLQQGTPAIHMLHQRLQDTFIDLFVRYVKPTAISKTDNLFHLEHGNRDNQLSRADLKIGSLTRKHLECLKEAKLLSSAEETNFFQDVRRFYASSVGYILDKFPMNNEVLENAKVLDVRARLKMKSSMAVFFAQRVRGIVAESDMGALEIEFAKYQVEPLDDSIISEKDVGKQWATIGSIKTVDGNLKFSLLTKLMKAIMTIPHSNADSERIFSMVKKNHTEFRARMGVKTLASLMIQKTHLQAQAKCCFDTRFEDALIRKAKRATMESLQ